MKTSIISTLLGFALAASLSAGGITIMNAGPDGILKFEVTAREAKMDFTLAQGSNSGSFVLPDEKATIKAYSEGIEELEVPPSEKPRFAILMPAKEGYTWHLFEAKPSGDTWAFRIVNLSADTGNVLSSKELIEIPAGQEKKLEVARKSQINLKIPSTVNLSYEGDEPCGVVAFVYRHEDEWKAFLLPDR